MFNYARNSIGGRVLTSPCPPGARQGREDAPENGTIHLLIQELFIPRVKSRIGGKKTEEMDIKGLISSTRAEGLKRGKSVKETHATS